MATWRANQLQKPMTLGRGARAAGLLLARRLVRGDCGFNHGGLRHAVQLADDPDAIRRDPPQFKGHWQTLEIGRQRGASTGGHASRLPDTGYCGNTGINLTNGIAGIP